MRVGSMEEGWSQYTRLFPLSGGIPKRPPEGIMVFAGVAFVGGCSIYPAEMGTMLVMDILVARSPGVVPGWPTKQEVLTFMFKVLRGHADVSNRLPLIDLSGLDAEGVRLPLEPALLWVLDDGVEPVKVEQAVEEALVVAEKPKEKPKPAKKKAKRKRKVKKAVKDDSGEKA